MWSENDQSETTIIIIYEARAENNINADKNQRNFLNFSWVFPRATHKGASIELSFV